MMRLERVLVTQFYLYEAEEVDLGEITAMFGPNGSGKSSFLDAVQIAIAGGNKNWIALNAQADDDKKGVARSVRSYCLGQYGEMTHQRARDNARTYITLIWKNSDTGEPLSMGICIYAYADRDKEDVRGRYILPGVELSLGDHLESVDEGTRPRDWESFRHQIRTRTERIKGAGVDPVYVDSDRFVRAMLLALRGSGGVPDSSLFSRAFRFALRMKFDKAVDQIVREEVLESNPTQIDKFKEVTESFRRLKEMVDQLEEKIRDGEKVAAEYVKARAELHRNASWRSLGARVEVQIAREHLEACVLANDDAENKLQSCQQTQENIGKQIADSQDELRGVRSLREGHQAHKDFGALQATVHTETVRAKEKAAGIASNIALVRRTLSSAAESPLLKKQAAQLTTAAQAMGALEDNIETVDTEKLEASLRPTLKVAKAAVNDLFQQGTELGTALSKAKEAYKAAEEDLRRAKMGKAPLSDDVRRLKFELTDHGLHPQPVCDLVRVVDKAWQPAIEAYLKRNVEALLIPDKEEREAFRLYRTMPQRDAVYGVKIAMESRQAIGKIPEVGSVAELIDGDHPAAVAYVRRQFGDLLRAETDAEAMAGRRTLTSDGMLVSSGEIERLKLPSLLQCRIGIESREHLAEASARMGACKTVCDNLEDAEKPLKALLESLMNLPGDGTAIKFLGEALAEMRSSQRSAENAMKQMQSAGNDEYVALSKQEEVLEAQIGALSIQRDNATEAIGHAKRALEECMAQEREAKGKLSAADVAANKAQQAIESDREFELKQWDVLLEKFETRYEEMLSHCNNQENSCRRRMDTAIQVGSTELGSFQRQYRESYQADIAKDWMKTHEWINALLKRLKDTQLVQYKADMEAAYRTSQETFKHDVALALKERLDFLHETMDRLNAVLKKCPTFSNGERYQFSAILRPQLEKLHGFIKAVAAHGPDGNLFGSPGNLPVEFQQLLNDKVATGAGGRSALDDYREFYEFDIEILREEPVTKTLKLIGHLSKRIGPGSGGEHRSPLYVIAGAALASAYRLDPNNSNGIRLMLIDEAFNKMDPTNITATMRYLEDLGLQLFMASPGENQGTLNAFLHRYYDVTRDVENNTVMLTGHSVPTEIRELHRADLLEFNPALIEEELELMRAERLAV
ncbi:MAG: SbcC/MukB-like Walker B domain-containing protein [Betaproteobacteria bacterium]|nr:SbcC/MukB-like Walker B domain-containing protein [Betaproteobacteria bacterium]